MCYFLESEFSYGSIQFLKTRPKSVSHIFFIHLVVYVFTDLVFNDLILAYCSYLNINIHNMYHIVSEYRLLYGRFYLFNSPFLTSDACKKLSLCFQFLNTNIFLKNVVNIGNNLPNHIKVVREYVIVELWEILPVCNIHFVLGCNMWLVIFINITVYS